MVRRDSFWPGHNDEQVFSRHGCVSDAAFTGTIRQRQRVSHADTHTSNTSSTAALQIPCHQPLCSIIYSNALLHPEESACCIVMLPRSAAQPSTLPAVAARVATEVVLQHAVHSECPTAGSAHTSAAAAAAAAGSPHAAYFTASMQRMLHW